MDIPQLKPRNLLPTSIRYGIAVVACLVALVLSVMAWSLVKSTPFIFFFPAVAFAAWRGGLGPGMLCAALTITSLDFFLFEPRYQFFTSPVEVLQFGIFALVAFLISWLENRRLYSQRAALDAREELEVILNSVTDAITVQDAAGRIVFANRSASEMAGYPTSEAMQGLSPEQLTGTYIAVDENDKPITPSILPRTRVFLTGKSSEMTFRRLNKNTGEYRWMTGKASPVFDQHGNVRLAVTVYKDITAEKMEFDANARLAAIVESSYDAILRKDLDGTIVSWNKGAERMYGYTAEEIIGKPVTVLFPPELMERDQRLLPRMLQGSRVEHYETVRIRKDGERINISLSISPIIDAKGNITGYSTISRDITAAKKAQHELLRLAQLLDAQRTRLKNVLVNVPGIIWEAHRDGPGPGLQRVEYLSDYAEKLLGYPLEKWTQNPKFLEEIVVPEDLPRITDDLAAIARRGGAGVHQFRCVAADGRIVTLENHLTVNLDEQGKPETAYGVMMDITERNRVEESLAQYAEELKRSNRELEQFAYVASHDLQEPLRMVTSYLQLIEQRYVDKLDADGREFINFAVSGAGRMKMLIGDLLTYSRVQRDQNGYERVRLQAVLNRALNSLALTIEETGAKVTHDPLPEVMANEAQMFQLFQNLLSNALKFHGKRPPEIHIGVELLKREWQFCIHDNGIGIEPAFLERIFVIFQRLHPKEAYPGTGIGLAICKKVVENHGGRIWAESQPGEGTTFYFTIPTRRRRRITADGTD